MTYIISKPVRVRARLPDHFPDCRKVAHRIEESTEMRIFIYLSAALLVGIFAASRRGATVAEGSGTSSLSGSGRPELEYLKAVNSVAPPRDPQLLFLLMAEYANANLQGEGAEFFSARLNEFGPRLTDIQKALYLSAIGLFR